jgi:lipopolysaccharide/colanic/teichoic acid biosynthesis glycosyltransferase/NDP-sugar pyrophosphorylase family protein
VDQAVAEIESLATRSRASLAFAPPVAGVKAVILCADRTPWLTDSTTEVPREIQVLNRPLREWQIDALKAAGVAGICCVTPGPATEFEPAVGGVFGWRHANPMGSAGVLGPLGDWLGDEPFLLVCGSTFVDARCIRALLQAPRPSDPHWAGTVGIGRSASGYDVREALAVDSEGRVRHIDRRHRSEERRTLHHVSGVFLLSGRVLSHLPAGQYCDLKDQLMPALRERGYFFDTRHTEHSLPLLRPADRLTLQARLLTQSDGVAPVPASSTVSAQSSLRGRVVLGEGVVVEAGARVIGPVVIGAGSRIGEGATVIGPACLGRNCRLERDAVLVRSLLEDDVVLGAASQVDHSLLHAGHEVEPAGQRVARDEIQVPQLSPGGTRRTTRWTPWRTAPAGPSRGPYDVVKRALDLATAAALTLLLLPLGLLIALAIKLDSPGPVFFVQRRCGHGGREFPLIKFRTMVTDADRMLQELRKVNEMDGPTFKLTRDPRVTRLGAWLRRTSLDELPQLLNVLAGQMSLVGPRPLKMSEMISNAHWRDARLSVMPGITGLWQVEGRDSRHFHHWVQLDLEYVRNRSLWFDLKILFKTAGAMRRGT